MIICGIDEAGRGPLAGPVCAACVILPDDFPINILADSKKLSAAQREQALESILKQAFWGLGWASVQEIDTINILQATFLAMQRAFRHLHHCADLALIDGNQNPHLEGIASRTVIKGDDKEPCIMAASIVAKCLRDRYMHRLDMQFPEYHFAQHKGYGTKLHRQAISQYGSCACHRKTFLKKI